MRFPTVYASCMAGGVDPVAEPIPSRPPRIITWAALAADMRGRTSLAGLWAAGEFASTGVHGANRLASNSLLEAVVFAARIASDIRRAEPRDSARPRPDARSKRARPTRASSTNCAM